MTSIPHREELDRRLGGVQRLDGSFGSLWAIERILQAIRRVPECEPQIAWVSSYMCDLFERAFSEMGMVVKRTGASSLHVTSPISYRVDVAHDLARLIRPPEYLPTFHKIFWLGSPILGTACAPWYGLSTIFQNNSWAQTDHDMIGNQRDRMDRAVPWLTQEYVRVLGLAPEHLELARSVARHIAWPPLGYAQNDTGGHNLPRLRAVIDEADALSSRAVLDAFVASQDRACRLLAARTALDVGIPPDTRHEAHVYRDVIEMFPGVKPSPFIDAAIKALLEPLETPNEDADHPDYAAAFDASPARGLELARRVLAREPKLPTFHCCAGWHQEQLGDRRGALESYDRAIALKPDYAQAMMNRGALLSMMGELDRAASDFFEARELQPENLHATMNLLVNHFMAEQKKTPAPAPAASHRREDAGASQALARGVALRGLLTRYGREQIDLNTAMRAMFTHADYMVPSIFLPPDVVHADGVQFSETQSFPDGELWVFSDREAATRAQAERGTLGLYSCGQSARAVVETFAAHPFSRLRLNPVGPEDEGFIFLPDSIGLLRIWLSGLAVEEAAALATDAELRDALLAHQGLLVAVRQRQALGTRTPRGLVVHVAATIDRAMSMVASLGPGVEAAPLPAANLIALMRACGADFVQIEGFERFLPRDVLEP